MDHSKKISGDSGLPVVQAPTMVILKAAPMSARTMPPSETPPPHDSAPNQTLVPLKLVRVVLRERSDQQWIFLQEDDPDKVDQERGFPIVIGTGEASEIHRLVTGVSPPRPLTHQLTVNAIEALGSRVIGVDIVDLRSNTFYAQLRLAMPGTDGSLDQEALVDARPSDALAIALRCGAPIRVAESVLEEVRSDKAQDVIPDGLPDELSDEFPDGNSDADAQDGGPGEEPDGGDDADPDTDSDPGPFGTFDLDE